MKSKNESYVTESKNDKEKELEGPNILSIEEQIELFADILIDQYIKQLNEEK